MHIWLWGDAGTGKSANLWRTYPHAYRKLLNKWWDGYENQDVVIIEEMNPTSLKALANHMKLWADRYPFVAEIKGASLYIRPQLIVVTSNYSIRQCLEDAQSTIPPESFEDY